MRADRFSRPQLLVFVLAFALIGFILIKSFAAPNVNLPGDLNNDNVVNISDMSILLSDFNSTDPTKLAQADINNDSHVDILDLSTLLSHFGQTYTPAQSLTQTSSLVNSATISGTYAWKITTNITEGKVQFFVENTSLATITGTTSFTYNLDTTKYPDGAHNGGYWIYDTTGAVVYKSPSISFTVQNGTVSGGGGGGTGTGQIVDFGSYAGGNLSEVNNNVCPSTNNFQPHVGGGPNNTNWARLTSSATAAQCYGDTQNIRVHEIWPTKPAWFENGQTVWRAISIRIPSGFSDSSDQYLFAGDEVHGDNGTGPAPLNLTIDSGYWRIIIRGSDYPTAGSNYPFAQYSFGAATGSTVTGQYFKKYQSWNGGNKPVVLDEWVHFRMGFHFDYTDNNGVGNGWFVAYARWGNMTTWLNIVPQVSNIPLGYPDTSGDGKAVYPILSLYRMMSGASGTYAIDYADGAWSNDYTTLINWQNSRLGF